MNLDELHRNMANVVTEVAKAKFDNFKSDGQFNIHYRQGLLYYCRVQAYKSRPKMDMLQVKNTKLSTLKHKK